MQRLVYAPKVYAWVVTEGQTQPFNLSKYITGGRVVRKINAVSEAEITLRNPDMIFTKGSKFGKPLFKPMDPITIWLQRLAGHPVQAFTGYLDSSPYVQIYPGICTITASCTLKRLQYTFWDPALDYSNAFMASYGWTANPANGTLSKPQAIERELKNSKGDPVLTDGSIGNLLFGTLKQIGGWDPDTIHIEELPKGLVRRLADTYYSLAADAKEVGISFESFIRSYIGTNSLGGGGTGAPPSAGNPGTDVPSGDKNIDAVYDKALEIHKANFPYVYGGGHGEIGKPSGGTGRDPGIGYDCSGYISAALNAGGFLDTPLDSGSFMSWGKPGEGKNFTIWANPGHMFMEFKGREFKRADTSGGPPDGPHLRSSGRDTQGFTARHATGDGVSDSKSISLPESSSLGLNGDPANPSSIRPASSRTGVASVNDGAKPVIGSTESLADLMSRSKAVAFVNQMEWPSERETLEAKALSGSKSLMNDKPLLPFIQSLCGSALRSFQSLPNGDFFAFYPDYFGTEQHRHPYWEVYDIEITEGKMQLNDAALCTHMFVVGDTIFGEGDALTDIYERMISTGVVNIYDSAQSGFITHNEKTDKGSRAKQVDKIKAEPKRVAEFLNKYGVRPHLEEAPEVRSPFFESFLAYQKFQMAWSNQFVTDFRFTFMPEIFPGGLIAFPEHGLQCYVNEVTHTFNYEEGFTTTATLSSPATLSASKLDDDPIQYGLVRSGV